MSLSLPENVATSLARIRSAAHTIVGLSPHRLSAMRLEGFPRKRITKSEAHGLAGHDGVSWKPCVDALAALLGEAEWQGADLSVVLSNHYVHYVVIPAEEGLAAVEREALAEVFFRNTYGELAGDWELRVSPARKDATLACGVPRALLAGLREACGEGCRLRTIQPCLMPVVNRALATIGKGSGTLAVVEPGRITLAAIDAGQWRAVTGRAAEGNALAELLDQENALLGRATGQLWVCDMTGEAIVPPNATWLPIPLAPAVRALGVEEQAGLAAWGIH